MKVKINRRYETESGLKAFVTYEKIKLKNMAAKVVIKDKDGVVIKDKETTKLVRKKTSTFKGYTEDGKPHTWDAAGQEISGKDHLVKLWKDPIPKPEKEES